MKNSISKLLLSGLILSGFGLGSCSESKEQTSSSMENKLPAPPEAKKIDKALTIHGHTRNDPYYWMKDRENPEVKSYLEKENAYTKAVLENTEELQTKLYEEIIARIKQTDISVPYLSNGYFYFQRYEEGKEYPFYCRKQGSLESQEEVMLDANLKAKEYSFYQVGGLRVSPNNKLMAYGEDTLSRRIYTLRFRNLETGEDYPDMIPNTTGSAAWANDNQTVFYTLKDETLRSYKVMRHRLGTDASEDVEVFHESDNTFSTFVYRSKSGKYIHIGSESTLSSEYRFLSTDDPEGEFKVIQPRERKHEYAIDHYGDHFYIISNRKAKNFRLMRTSVNNSGEENWEELVGHRPDVLLEDIEIFKDYYVLAERSKGLTQLRIVRWSDGEEHYLPFGEEAYSAYLSVNREFDTKTLRFAYTSMTTPNSVFDYDMDTHEKSLKKQQEVVGGYEPSDYQTERIYAPAKDGTMIPVSLVYKKSGQKDKNRPLLLYGYGSYGYSMDPYFSSVRLSLLDRGFTYAIAHIRGGEELGRDWYENGKLLNKMNTFTDFIDCAEFLLKEGYTEKEHLFAMGGSAGGLLMGAVSNLRPDLWRGMIAAVPFVDVITTMLDESIPLTTGEYDEWGNPNDKQYYDYIMTYSPYDNVSAQDYPAMLITTGFHDSQVQYWEPAKWIARLRDENTGKEPLMLYTNLETGHSGSSGRFERHKETAMEYAFLLDCIGIKE